MTTIIVGIDPSMTSTGLARLTHSRGDWVQETTTIASAPERKRKKTEPQPKIRERHARMTSIVDRITTWADKADLVVIEGPSYGSLGGGQVDRYGLWWMILDYYLTKDIPVAVCPPQTRAKFATGKGGKTDKAVVAVAVAKMWPDSEIADSDEADALAMATAGAVAAGLEMPFPVPQYRLDSAAAMERPDGLAIPELAVRAVA